MFGVIVCSHFLILHSCLSDSPPEVGSDLQSGTVDPIANESRGSEDQLDQIKSAAHGERPFCAIRPDPEDCCDEQNQDCDFCRVQTQAALEKWRLECLPPFDELKTCDPGAKISTCCGDDSAECIDCRMKALKSMISWRQKCGVIEGENCDKPDPLDNCCKGGGVSCQLCRERIAKLRLDKLRRCGRKNLEK